MNPRFRIAFTLVELLVVIGVIGLLVSLLLPAVNKVRESANRGRCMNNLRQVGLAAQHHDADTGMLPSLGWLDEEGRVFSALYHVPGPPPEVILKVPYEAHRCIQMGPQFDSAGWGFQLLPYLEQENLFNGTGSRGSYPNAPLEYKLQYDYHGKGIVTILMTPLSVLRCPSRGDARVFTLPSNPYGLRHPFPYFPIGNEGILVNPSHQKPKNTPITVAQTDYAGNGGIGVGDTNGPLAFVQLHAFGINAMPDVAVRPARTTSPGRFPDGATHTILFGEKLINRARMHQPQADDIYGYASSYTPSTVRWCGGPAPAPYLTPVQDFRGPKGIDAGGRFGSAHPGGALFTFADGSVRPVSYSVHGEVFYALCVINDGRVVGEGEY